MRHRLLAFAGLFVFGAAVHVRAQPVLALDLAAVGGGDTNDVQLAYGGGVEFWRRGRLATGADFVYVRDFFEFEPDGPLDDARIYTDVLGAFANGRLSLTTDARPPVRPYLLVGPGWLRSRAMGRATDHFGINVGAGIGLWNAHRVGVRLETRYVAALTGHGDEPPEQRLSFWRTGLSVTVALRDRDRTREP
jgi:hypothetical protein